MRSVSGGVSATDDDGHANPPAHTAPLYVAIGLTIAASALAISSAPAAVLANCSPDGSWGTIALTSPPGRAARQRAPRLEGPRRALHLIAASGVVDLEVVASGPLRVLRPRRPGAARWADGLCTGRRLRVWRLELGREHRLRVWEPPGRDERLDRLGGHRANIENPGFTTIGVGVAGEQRRDALLDQNFGNDASASPPPPPPTATSPHRRPPPPPPSRPASPPPPASPAAPPPPPRRGATRVSVRTTSASSTGFAGSARTCSGDGEGRRRSASRPAHHASVDASTRRRVRVARQRAAAPTGDVRCYAEVAGKRLRVVTNAYRNGMARCAWRVPAGRAR